MVLCGLLKEGREKREEKRNHIKYIEQWFSRLLDTRNDGQWFPRVRKQTRSSPWSPQLTLLKQSPGHGTAQMEKAGQTSKTSKLQTSKTPSWERARVQKPKQIKFVRQSTREERTSQRELQNLQGIPPVFNAHTRT